MSVSAIGNVCPLGPRARPTWPAAELAGESLSSRSSTTPDQPLGDSVGTRA
jgi:hypothetical protein